jgi:hypothetical protein
MLNNYHDESRPSRVTVAFEDSALSFMLLKDATFEDLADRLDRLRERHCGKPIAIEAKFAAERRPARPMRTRAKASAIDAVPAGDREIQSTVPRSRRLAR